MKYIVDADVLIGALDRSDAHHADGRRLLAGWHAQQDPVLVSVVNLTEVLIAPSASEGHLRLARSSIVALGVAVHQPNVAIGVDAARLRARHPISLPDAYLLATARHVVAVIASFDAKVLRAAREDGLKTL